jgi:hypothetical protein
MRGSGMATLKAVGSSLVSVGAFGLTTARDFRGLTKRYRWPTQIKYGQREMNI